MYFELRLKPGRYATEACYDVEVLHDGRLVVIHERKDNPGMSITNAAEHVLTALVNSRPEITEDTIFVEHYPERGDNIPAIWDLMTPTWTEGRVTTMGWRSLGKDYFELRKGNFEAVFPISGRGTKPDPEEEELLDQVRNTRTRHL